MRFRNCWENFRQLGFLARAFEVAKAQAVMGAILLGLFLMSGCASVPAGKSVVSVLPVDASEVEFWHTLQTRPIATNDDAFHGLLLYVDGGDATSSYEARMSLLKQRGMLPRDFDGLADQAIERGTLAVALVKMLDFKGGLTMRLFGASPRYAMRELMYRRIYPESSERQLFSGAELLGIIGRMEDYKEGDPANIPAKVLYVGGPETPPATLEQASADDDVRYPAFLSTTALRNFSLLQPAASEPASKPAELKLPDGPLKLLITGVRGKAEVRVPPEEKWSKAEANAELSEGAELRTGLKSAVQLQIRPDQTITVDRLGVVKIDRATLAGGKFVTSVSMPYGRTRYDIDAANREYDATVRSPNSTLGIRGTRVSLFDQRPFAPEAVSLTGTAQFRNVRRQLVALGRRGQGKTKIVGGQSNAAQFALAEAVVDPTVANARTQSEQPLIASLLSRGAVFEFDRALGIPVVRGGTVPRTDAELLPILPGGLTFVTRWDTNVDFNIGVFGSAQLLFTAPGLVQNSAGGKIPFDHRGGANGGIEIANFPGPGYPRDNFGIAALNESQTTAHVRIEAFINGKRYNNENSSFGDLLNETNAFVASAIKGGYELDVTPGQVAAVLYDVEDSSDDGSTPALAAKSSAGKKVKTAIKPTPKATGKKPAGVSLNLHGPVAPANPAAKSLKR